MNIASLKSKTTTGEQQSLPNCIFSLVSILHAFESYLTFSTVRITCLARAYCADQRLTSGYYQQLASLKVKKKKQRELRKGTKFSSTKDKDLLV